jgi:hypothetical protein
MPSKCSRCRVYMKKGIAIQNTLSGVPDFIGSKEVITMSYSGPGKIIDVWKCPKCGSSKSIGESNKGKVK